MPDPPVFVVPVKLAAAMTCVLVPVVMFMLPHAVSKSVHDVFLELTVPPDLAPAMVIRPPALKKYRAELASAKVMVCVAVHDTFHAVDRVATPLRVMVDPTPAALLRLVKHEDKLAEKLALASMV